MSIITFEAEIGRYLYNGQHTAYILGGAKVPPKIIKLKIEAQVNYFPGRLYKTFPDEYDIKIISAFDSEGNDWSKDGKLTHSEYDYFIDIAEDIFKEET